MTKVIGSISQLGVKGSITQLGVKGSLSQKGVAGVIAESGVTHTPPVYVSGEVGTGALNVITLTYDINLDIYSTPATTDFTAVFSGGAVSVILVVLPVGGGGTRNTVEVTLSRAIALGETGTLSYTPGDDPIRGKDDNEGIAAALSSVVITNNVTGTIPVFVSAAVANATPTKVVLTYDQTLDGASVPATTDFTVTDHTISSVAIVGSTVELTLSTAVIYFDILYVTYTAGVNPIQGDVGELDAADLASTLITNNVAVTGNEVGWWLASDLTTITKDGSNFVSAWNDKLASGRNLLQATGSYQPLWGALGITFDGIDNWIQALFTMGNPKTVFICWRQLAYNASNTIIDGANLNSMRLQQANPADSPALSVNTYMSNKGLAVDIDGVVVFKALATGHYLRCVDTITTNAFASPADAAGGVTVGKYGTYFAAYGHCNGRVKEVIVINEDCSADYMNSLYNVVKRRAGL